jgi:hypothetical protein
MSQEILSLNLNSAFRNSGTRSDPEFILDRNIENISSVKLRSAMFPLTISLVDSRNNKLYLRETTSGSTTTITLSSGNYIVNGTESNSILTNIRTCLNTASPNTWTYNVSFNDITNRLTISSTNGNFALMSGLDNFYYEMGLDSSQLASFGSSLTMTDPIDLSGLKLLHIVSNIPLTKVFSQSFAILGSIIIEEETNQISSYEDQSSDYILSSISSIGSIRLSFYDDRFRKLTMNKDYSITINFITDE